MTQHRLELDFVAAAGARFLPLQLGLIAIGALLIALAGWGTFTERAHLAKLRLAVGRLEEAHRLAPVANATRDQGTDRQLKIANGVLDALEIPWEGLFAAVEKAGASGLGLVGLAPDAPTQVLRISGEANSLEEVLDYIRRLDQQSLLYEVHLMSYAPIERGAHPGVQFTIGAKWKPS